MGRIAALESAAEAEQLAAGERARTSAQQLRAAKAALREAEQGLAVQKKKNYTQAQLLAEAQKLRREAEAEHLAARRKPAQSLARASASAPHKVLSAHTSAAAPTQADAEPDLTPVQQAAVPQAPDIDLAQAAQDAEAASQSDKEAANAQEIGVLTDALAESRTALAESQAQTAQAQAEHRRLHKRLEDLRRVDLMSRGKLQVLEDKVARLGREHYEAISALALVRGEVALPKRRRAPPGPRAPQADGQNRPAPSPNGQMPHAKPVLAPSPSREPTPKDASIDVPRTRPQAADAPQPQA